MDTGTFYLYEYENNVRKRNAGFLKIYRRYQSCIFQAHIRSISLENVSEAEMYAFSRKIKSAQNRSLIFPLTP